MNILQTTRFSLKKVKFNKAKSLFIILPISLLIALIVIASSEALSLITVASNSIFSSIQSQNEIIELHKDGSGGGNGSFRMMTFGQNADSSYTNADVAAIDSIGNVDKASLISEIPVKNVVTQELFSNINVNLSKIAGLAEDYAKLYTDKSFSYTPGDNVIPIILNANDFKENYEDWNGKDEIDVDLSKLRQTFSPGNPPTSDPIASQSPAKTRSIPYDKNDLIGREITVSFGGLDQIADYKQESTSTGFKFVKKTAEELANETSARKDAISKYWDYDKVSTPLTYTFRIVGISEGEDKTQSYIPEAFATRLLQDYIKIELAARNSTAIPSEDLNSTFQGLVFDGVSLKDDALSSFFSGIKRQVGGQVREFNNSAKDNFTFSAGVAAPSQANIQVKFPDQAASYYIPGFVMKKDRTTEEITGEYKDFDFSQEIPLESTIVLIKINNIDNREQVISGLNAKGYTFQDFSKFKEFKKLETYLNTVLSIGSIIFMVITALFILINMAKFVSESRKEIGIFRAIGSTKSKIRKIIIVQSFIYIVLAIVCGLIIGIAGVIALSSVIVNYAQNFINSTVGGIIPLTGSLMQSDFISFDFRIIAIYIIILLMVTLIVSLWPAEQAAKVSPVEAIRN